MSNNTEHGFCPEVDDSGLSQRVDLVLPAHYKLPSSITPVLAPLLAMLGPDVSMAIGRVNSSGGRAKFEWDTLEFLLPVVVVEVDKRGERAESMLCIHCRDVNQEYNVAAPDLILMSLLMDATTRAASGSRQSWRDMRFDALSRFEENALNGTLCSYVLMLAPRSARYFDGDGYSPVQSLDDYERLVARLTQLFGENMQHPWIKCGHGAFPSGVFLNYDALLTAVEPLRVYDLLWAFDRQRVSFLASSACILQWSSGASSIVDTYKNSVDASEFEDDLALMSRLWCKVKKPVKRSVDQMNGVVATSDTIKRSKAKRGSSHPRVSKPKKLRNVKCPVESPLSSPTSVSSPEEGSEVKLCKLVIVDTVPENSTTTPSPVAETSTQVDLPSGGSGIDTPFCDEDFEVPLDELTVIVDKEEPSCLGFPLLVASDVDSVLHSSAEQSVSTVVDGDTQSLAEQLSTTAVDKDDTHSSAEQSDSTAVDLDSTHPSAEPSNITIVFPSIVQDDAPQVDDHRTSSPEPLALQPASSFTTSDNLSDSLSITPISNSSLLNSSTSGLCFDELPTVDFNEASADEPMQLDTQFVRQRPNVNFVQLLDSAPGLSCPFWLMVQWQQQLNLPHCPILPLCKCDISPELAHIIPEVLYCFPHPAFAQSGYPADSLFLPSIFFNSSALLDNDCCYDASGESMSVFSALERFMQHTGADIHWWNNYLLWQSLSDPTIIGGLELSSSLNMSIDSSSQFLSSSLQPFTPQPPTSPFFFQPLSASSSSPHLFPTNHSDGLSNALGAINGGHASMMHSLEAFCAPPQQATVDPRVSEKAKLVQISTSPTGEHFRRIRGLLISGGLWLQSVQNASPYSYDAATMLDDMSRFSDVMRRTLPLFEQLISELSCVPEPCKRFIEAFEAENFELMDKNPSYQQAFLAFATDLIAGKLDLSSAPSSSSTNTSSDARRALSHSDSSAFDYSIPTTSGRGRGGGPGSRGGRGGRGGRGSRGRRKGTTTHHHLSPSDFHVSAPMVPSTSHIVVPALSFVMPQ